MKVHFGLDQDTDIQKSVTTTGTFDGVHIGHQVIIHRINELARMVGGESVLITFSPHPRKILYPDTLGKSLKMINTQREKIALLESTGLDHLVIMPFTLEFAHTPSDVFIRETLVHKLNVRKSVVGFNHFFGFNKEGNYDQLVAMGKIYGFEVEEIPEQDIQNETVSSTKIRKAIEEGNIQRANAYLNHILLMMGKIDLTPVNNKTFGFNSYDMAPEEPEKLLPAAGIYAVRVKQGKKNLKAIAVRSINHDDIEDIMRIIPVDDFFPIPGIDATLLFYKQLVKDFDNETDTAKSTLSNAIFEANELIY